MRVEVVYALPQRQQRVLLDLAPGSTVQDAIQASGLLRHLPADQADRVGIWGRPVSPQTGLRDLDRVEIYRPLLADPKQVRRERAAGRRK
jgi:hypothetical protein